MFEKDLRDVCVLLICGGAEDINEKYTVFSALEVGEW
jgi:hypothetical protein